MRTTMTRPENTDKFLTPQGVGRLLKITARTVIRWAEEGQLPGRKIGSVWRFSAARLDAFMNGEVEPAKDTG